jgi:hypothetical protein
MHWHFVGHHNRQRARIQAREEYTNKLTGTTVDERARLYNIWDLADDLPKKKDNLYRKVFNKIINEITDGEWKYSLEGKFLHNDHKISNFLEFVETIKSSETPKTKDFLAEVEIFLDEVLALREFTDSISSEYRGSTAEEYKQYIENNSPHRERRDPARIKFEEEARKALMKDNDYRLMYDPELRAIDFDYAPIIELKKALGMLSLQEMKDHARNMNLGYNTKYDNDLAIPILLTDLYAYNVPRKHGKVAGKIPFEKLPLQQRLDFANNALDYLQKNNLLRQWRPGDYYANDDLPKQWKRVESQKKHDQNYDPHNTEESRYVQRQLSDTEDSSPENLSKRPESTDPWQTDFSKKAENTSPFVQSRSFNQEQSPQTQGNQFRMTDEQDLSRPYWESTASARTSPASTHISPSLGITSRAPSSALFTTNNIQRDTSRSRTHTTKTHQDNEYEPGDIRSLLAFDKSLDRSFKGRGRRSPTSTSATSTDFSNPIRTSSLTSNEWGSNIPEVTSMTRTSSSRTKDPISRIYEKHPEAVNWLNRDFDAEMSKMDEPTFRKRIELTRDFSKPEAKGTMFPIEILSARGKRSQELLKEYRDRQYEIEEEGIYNPQGTPDEIDKHIARRSLQNAKKDDKKTHNSVNEGFVRWALKDELPDDFHVTIKSRFGNFEPDEEPTEQSKQAARQLVRAREERKASSFARRVARVKADLEGGPLRFPKNTHERGDKRNKENAELEFIEWALRDELPADYTRKFIPPRGGYAPNVPRTPSPTDGTSKITSPFARSGEFVRSNQFGTTREQQAEGTKPWWERTAGPSAPKVSSSTTSTPPTTTSTSTTPSSAAQTDSSRAWWDRTAAITSPRSSSASMTPSASSATPRVAQTTSSTTSAPVKSTTAPTFNFDNLNHDFFVRSTPKDVYTREMLDEIWLKLVKYSQGDKNAVLRTRLNSALKEFFGEGVSVDGTGSLHIASIDRSGVVKGIRLSNDQQFYNWYQVNLKRNSGERALKVRDTIQALGAFANEFNWIKYTLLSSNPGEAWDKYAKHINSQKINTHLNSIVRNLLHHKENEPSDTTATLKSPTAAETVSKVISTISGSKSPTASLPFSQSRSQEGIKTNTFTVSKPFTNTGIPLSKDFTTKSPTLTQTISKVLTDNKPTSTTISRMSNADASRLSEIDKALESLNKAHISYNAKLQSQGGKSEYDERHAQYARFKEAASLADERNTIIARNSPQAVKSTTSSTSATPPKAATTAPTSSRVTPSRTPPPARTAAPDRTGTPRAQVTGKTTSFPEGWETPTDPEILTMGPMGGFKTNIRMRHTEAEVVNYLNEHQFIPQKGRSLDEELAANGLTHEDIHNRVMQKSADTRSIQNVLIRDTTTPGIVIKYKVRPGFDRDDWVGILSNIYDSKRGMEYARIQAERTEDVHGIRDALHAYRQSRGENVNTGIPIVKKGTPKPAQVGAEDIEKPAVKAPPRVNPLYPNITKTHRTPEQQAFMKQKLTYKHATISEGEIKSFNDFLELAHVNRNGYEKNNLAEALHDNLNLFHVGLRELKTRGRYDDARDRLNNIEFLNTFISKVNPNVGIYREPFYFDRKDQNKNHNLNTLRGVDDFRKMRDILGAFQIANVMLYSRIKSKNDWMLYNLFSKHPYIKHLVDKFNSDPNTLLTLELKPHKQEAIFSKRNDSREDSALRRAVRLLNEDQIKELQGLYNDHTIPLYITDDKRVLVPQESRGGILVPYKNLGSSVMKSLALDTLKHLEKYNIDLPPKQPKPYDYILDPKGKHPGDYANTAEEEALLSKAELRPELWPHLMNRPIIKHTPSQERVEPRERYLPHDLEDIDRAAQENAGTPEIKQVADLIEEANEALNAKSFNDERKIEEWFWNHGIKGITLRETAGYGDPGVALTTDSSLPRSLDDMHGKLVNILPEFIKYINSSRPNARPENWSDVDEFTSLLNSYGDDPDSHAHLFNTLIMSDPKMGIDGLHKTRHTNPADAPFYGRLRGARLLGKNNELNINPKFLPYVIWKMHSMRRDDLERSKQILNDIHTTIKSLYRDDPQFSKAMIQKYLGEGNDIKPDLSDTYISNHGTSQEESIHLKRGFSPGKIVKLLEQREILLEKDLKHDHKGMLVKSGVDDIKKLEYMRRMLGLTKDAIADYAVANKLSIPFNSGQGLTGIHRTYSVADSPSNIDTYSHILSRMTQDSFDAVGDRLKSKLISPVLSRNSNDVTVNFHNALEKLHNYLKNKSNLKSTNEMQKNVLNTIFGGLDPHGKLKSMSKVKDLPDLYSTQNDGSKVINREWLPLVESYFDHLVDSSRDIPSLDNGVLRSIEDYAYKYNQNATTASPTGITPEVLSGWKDSLKQEGKNFTRYHKDALARWLDEDTVEKFHANEYMNVRAKTKEEEAREAEAKVNPNKLLFADKGITYDYLDTIRDPFQRFVQFYFNAKSKQNIPDEVNFPFLWYAFNQPAMQKNIKHALASTNPLDTFNTIAGNYFNEQNRLGLQVELKNYEKWKQANYNVIPAAIRAQSSDPGAAATTPLKQTPPPRVSPSIAPSQVPTPIQTASRVASTISGTPITEAIKSRVYSPTSAVQRTNPAMTTGFSQTNLPTSARFAGTGIPSRPITNQFGAQGSQVPPQQGYSPSSAFMPRAQQQRVPVSGVTQFAPDPNQFRMGVSNQVPVNTDNAPRSSMFTESPLNRFRQTDTRPKQLTPFNPVERYNMQAELKKINELNDKMQMETRAANEAYIRKTQEAEETRQRAYRAAREKDAAQEKNVERVPYNKNTHLNDLLKWWRDEGAKTYEGLKLMAKRGQPGRALLKEAMDWARTRPAAYDLIQHDTDPKRDDK